jgi:hypothetical protein
MNGFNNEKIYGNPKGSPYSYVPHAESKPYWARRNSTRVSSRINISSPLRHNRASTCRSRCGGAVGQDRRRRDDHAEAQVRTFAAALLQLRNTR